MTHYEKFRELADKTYEGCTTEQKLGVYVQHHPSAVVPFLLELISELYPEDVEADDDTARTD